MIATIVFSITLVIVLNVLKQLILSDPRQPPIVFHWVPLLGSTIEYGIHPEAFFVNCRAKYGDVFTFILLGKKTTVCLGTKGNDFILNGKISDVNAEQIYRNLTAPVFGEGVVYDVPNAKMMEQKKFLKFGITVERLRSYVPLIAKEFYELFSVKAKGPTETLDISEVMAELTIYTASRTLQGEEVRRKFDSKFATLYHDLDMGFAPINFIAPWLPLPANRRRDRAQRRIAQVYMEIIARRRSECNNDRSEDDMIRHLMSSKYKSGDMVSDKEVAHILIALLMAGQHSSSSVGAWTMLRLCSRPDIQDALFQEQIRELGPGLPEPTYDDLARLTLNTNVVKETLRLHAPIHSIMRAVVSPLEISSGSPGSERTYNIPTTHVLLAAPGVTAQAAQYFQDPAEWDPYRWEKHVEPSKNSEEVDYGYGMVSKGTNSPFLPFGAGRHRCIGEQFAYVQLGTIVALMVRSFRLRLVDREDNLPKTDYSSLFSRPISPARLVLERRQNV